MRPFIGCRRSANAVTKLDPSSNSLSLADSGSITELDMPKGRPSRLRKRPVTAGAIVIPIHFDIVVSLPRQRFVVTSVWRQHHDPGGKSYMIYIDYMIYIML